MGYPIVLGHRGAPRIAPENTLAAFRAALDAGADGVELDVRLTATGELAVCHDPTLWRYTGAAVRVAGVSAWALRQYDLGGGQRVPLLGEVLAALVGNIVNVEVKVDDGASPRELARAVAAALARPEGRAPRRVIVSSFEPDVLAHLARRAPGVPRGLLLPPEPLAAADVAARGARVALAAVHPHHSVCTPERVADWHARGLEVNTWTVDAPEDLQRVARAGVDTVITNEPAVARGALAGRR